MLLVMLTGLATGRDRGSQAKSITGYVCWIAGGVVSAKAKRQTTVALSTCESEYVAIAAAAQEVIYLRQLLKDLHEPRRSQPPYCVTTMQQESSQKRRPINKGPSTLPSGTTLFRSSKAKRTVVKRIEWKGQPSRPFTNPLPPITFKKHIQHLFG